jgi:hypothetical protein
MQKPDIGVPGFDQRTSVRLFIRTIVDLWAPKYKGFAPPQVVCDLTDPSSFRHPSLIFRKHARLGVFIMDPIPFSAVALVIVVLLVTWLFLAHMMSNREDDARLHFLLGIMGAPQAEASHSDAAGPPPAAVVPETNPAKPVQERADEFVSRGISGVARYASQELPVVFAAALRSRTM